MDGLTSDRKHQSHPISTDTKKSTANLQFTAHAACGPATSCGMEGGTPPAAAAAAVLKGQRQAQVKNTADVDDRLVQPEGGAGRPTGCKGESEGNGREGGVGGAQSPAKRAQTSELASITPAHRHTGSCSGMWCHMAREGDVLES